MLSELKSLTASQASLAGYTRPGLVLPQLYGRDAAGIIHELSQTLQREGSVPDVLPFYHTALNQELLFNSALPSGVAVPHARLAAVSQLQFALGRAPEPVTWGARGAAAVDLVFLIAVPATNAASYLHLLAAIARLADRPEMLQDLRHASSRAALLELLGQVPIT